ncbi:MULTISPECIES: HisA/HisF-related TIM barrel protein [Bacillus]|uniref:HisA/HisF-related TIM barrel protein n=1 Tax=Bacillus TaxID=1386 RepID=UPI002242EAD1|nr:MULTISPECIES: HisA/HisF-related TIM barrel protein [Bacillus]MDN5386234.1 hypothetical protein [Bacillus sp. LB7]MEC1020420.1 hypothetical protein [Bacillus paralicheniformis]MEC1026425.1 hypothetical protein [Bacillus paralicheniformis]MEC1036655.1 hypothetical protein [Bacillus paralicheniformis]MEC1052898.1 hypothetical protein [Bacillus paralicheniformis]
MSKLIHCFGNSKTAIVDTELAIHMLKASGCEHLAVNTHSINEVKSREDLPVGYFTATVGSILDHFDENQKLIPVLNINLPVSAEEAVERTLKAVELTNWNIIKLEVLSDDYRLVKNEEVLKAAKMLLRENPSLEIWPLFTPDIELAKEFENMGCTLLRVMGSPIGSSKGIDPGWLDDIKRILERSEIKVMLDGGVGAKEHAVQAMKLGFDQVLVNSCLFVEGADPVQKLTEFREALYSVEHI